MFDLQYLSGKANVVADALNRKNKRIVTSIACLGGGGQNKSKE